MKSELFWNYNDIGSGEELI